MNSDESHEGKVLHEVRRVDGFRQEKQKRGCKKDRWNDHENLDHEEKSWCKKQQKQEQGPLHGAVIRSHDRPLGRRRLSELREGGGRSRTPGSAAEAIFQGEELRIETG